MYFTLTDPDPELTLNFLSTVFSMAAIFAALAIAVIEHRRAVNGGAAQVNDTADAALGLLDELCGHRRLIEEFLPQAGPEQQDAQRMAGQVSAWTTEAALVLDSLQVIRATAAADAPLLLAITSAVRHLEKTIGTNERPAAMHGVLWDLPAAVVDRAKEVLRTHEELDKVRSKISGRRRRLLTGMRFW